MPENALRGWHLVEHLARSSRACRLRNLLDQSTPAEFMARGVRSVQQLCIHCGRITARRNRRGLPWCGGYLVTWEQWVREIAPARFVGDRGVR